MNVCFTSGGGEIVLIAANRDRAFPIWRGAAPRAARCTGAPVHGEMNWYDALIGTGSALLRTIVIGFGAYIALVTVLRFSGKRTLSKWSAFDLVVTVALGSAFANALVSKDVSLVQGVVTFAVLASLQFIVSWASVRSSWLRRLSRSQPQLLLLNGKLLPDAMRQERVTENELRASLRAQGIADVLSVGAVVLETDGRMSVIRVLGSPEVSTLQDVRGMGVGAVGGEQKHVTS